MDILEHIRLLSASGTVEIRLTGQDLSAYGHDRGETALPPLLTRINIIPGSFRVRVGMMNPATLLPVADAVAQAIGGDRFFRFIHLPVQSGSDTILSRMGRGYRVRDAKEIVRILRSRLPDLTLAIDLICGFPGETEEDHRMNLQVISDLMPDMVNITRYSYRPGSGCDRRDELPDRIRKERSRELVAEAYRLILGKRLHFVDSEETVVVTEILRDGTVMGRTATYQGVVIRSDLSPGSVCLIRITEARTHYLVGERISVSV
jgi:MiaB/RimO family radical SAM methylthiotransferase